MNSISDSFFSVSFDLILRERPLPYDLFINSSGKVERERFVRIFPLGGVLGLDDLDKFKLKYKQLYIPEKQRDAYLRSLINCEHVGDVEKTAVIKDSAIGYLNKVFDPSKEFTTEVLEEAIDGCRESVESMIDVIEDYDISQVSRLIGDLSFHDFYTYDHSINVSMYCISLYQALKPNATREEIVIAGLGGLLHDLGKTKIPTTIINNPGKLSDEDFEVIKKHPGYGKDLLDSVMDSDCCSDEDIDFSIIQRVVYEHHENFNGTGYPNKLKGDEIHIFARITAIADFFDAITTKRSYHEVLSVEDAIAVIEKSCGKKIDPKLFKIFAENVNKLKLKGKTNQALPDTFDPCQPHDKLPFQLVTAAVQERDIFKKEEKGFGKVSGEPLFGNSEKKKAS